MGYPYGKKAWRLHDLESHEFFESRDVIFHEEVFPFHKSSVIINNIEALEVTSQQPSYMLEEGYPSYMLEKGQDSLKNQEENAPTELGQQAARGNNMGHDTMAQSKTGQCPGEEGIDPAAPVGHARQSKATTQKTGGAQQRCNPIQLPHCSKRHQPRTLVLTVRQAEIHKQMPSLNGPKEVESHQPTWIATYVIVPNTKTSSQLIQHHQIAPQGDGILYIIMSLVLNFLLLVKIFQLTLQELQNQKSTMRQ